MSRLWFKTSRSATTGHQGFMSKRGFWVKDKTKPKANPWIVDPYINDGRLWAPILKFRDEYDDLPSPAYLLIKDMKKFCQEREMEFHVYEGQYVRFSFKHKQDAEFFVLAWAEKDVDL